MPDCSLCSESLGPVLAQSGMWRVVLNQNQNLLGKCFVATHRHVEDVTDLTADEWKDLRFVVGAVTAALRQTTQPDHFNYSFLMNQDRHVHLHVLPRYASTRTMLGETFEDAEFPDHYAVGATRRLAPDQIDSLVATFKDAMRAAI